ncbi:MAG: DNA methyltransferase [Trueperaceae bacterium]|nr:DNA methyltransferase [Trueperaceae bacterium]
MNQDQRNNLRSAVQEMRRLLEDDLGQQLSATYGIRDDGTVFDLAKLPHLHGDSERLDKREIMLGAIRDYAARRAAHSAKANQAIAASDREDYLRAHAFTLLNRFAGLRLLEARDYLMNVLKGGKEAQGFKFFTALAKPTLPLGEDGYTLYIDLMLEEVATTIPALRERSGKFDTLRASEGAVLELIAAMDALPDDIWRSDETLGWIFQYFTPEERRKKARKASAAPRNSDELAFRNQFFTPDYVVRFLVQNTLGRIWLEMHPETALKETWAYLVEEGLEPREYKPPYDLKVIDPACGSGHFLLYSFEVLHDIYHEVYRHPELGHKLRADYPDPDDFARSVPEVIIANNLYGVDIDRRVVQVTQVALYLKAKRLHQGAEPKLGNIVFAQQLPGSDEDFERFTDTAITDAQEHMWVKSALKTIYSDFLHADELGIMLKTDEKLEQIFDQGPLFDMTNLLTRTEDVLDRYIDEASQDAEVLALMFGDESRQALKLLELMQYHYDVVLMNPPFGAAAKNSKKAFEKLYPKTKNDLYAAFVERGLDLLHTRGRLGAITSRTGFFLKSYKKWREEILLGMGHLAVVADLGYGVLDKAMVEVAAYVVERK